MLVLRLATIMTSALLLVETLENRAVISVEGPDAEIFLHGLVTAEVRSLEPGMARYGALLNPQGKILFDFFIVRTAEGFLLDGSADQHKELVRRLSFYKLRAKVAIASRPDLGVTVSQNTLAFPLSFVDPRTSMLGFRAIAPVSELPSANVGAFYREARIALGIADSEEIGSGVLFPHEANFDQFGGVNFSKGCYVGQEVVSRMEHRATVRSRICPVEISQAGPSTGDQITTGQQSVGTILATEDTMGLALVRLDRLSSAVTAGAPLLTGSATVHVRKPLWAKFDVAGG